MFFSNEINREQSTRTTRRSFSTFIRYRMRSMNLVFDFHPPPSYRVTTGTPPFVRTKYTMYIMFSAYNYYKIFRRYNRCFSGELCVQRARLLFRFTNITIYKRPCGPARHGEKYCVLGENRRAVSPIVELDCQPTNRGKIYILPAHGRSSEQSSLE